MSADERSFSMSERLQGCVANSKKEDNFETEQRYENKTIINTKQVTDDKTVKEEDAKMNQRLKVKVKKNKTVNEAPRPALKLILR